MPKGNSWRVPVSRTCVLIFVGLRKSRAHKDTAEHLFYEVDPHGPDLLKSWLRQAPVPSSESPSEASGTDPRLHWRLRTCICA